MSLKVYRWHILCAHLNYLPRGGIFTLARNLGALDAPNPVVATTLAGLTKDGMASKGLLRRANLATTTRHYVKDAPENTNVVQRTCNGLDRKT